MNVTQAASTARENLAYLWREGDGDLREAANSCLVLLQAAGVTSETEEP